MNERLLKMPKSIRCEAHRVGLSTRFARSGDGGSEARVRIVPDLDALPLPDGAEELAGAVEAPADGGIGAADDLGDLLAREALDVAEGEHRLVFRRQPVERL